MPTTKSHRPNASRASRGYNNSRGKLKKSVHPARLSGRGGRRRTTVRSPRNGDAHFLNPNIQPVSLFIIRDRSFFDSDYFPQEHIHYIIGNLYRILCNTPGFKDEKVWETRPSLAELADYLLEQVNNIHGDAYQYKFDNKGKLRFLTYREIPKLDNTHCIPLEWIPLLETKLSGPLYTLLLQTLGRVALSWRLDVVHNTYNDMIIESPEEYSQDEEDGYPVLISHVRKYTKGGSANAFMNRLQLMGGGVDQRSLATAIKSYRGKNKYEREIKKWLLLGVAALDSPTEITRYHFPEAHIENIDDYQECVHAGDMYAFPWSFWDRVFQHSESWIESVAQEGGVIGPTICTEYYPDHASTESPSLKAVQQLSDFMDFGREIYFRDFHDKLKEIYKNDGPTLLLNILT